MIAVAGRVLEAPPMKHGICLSLTLVSTCILYHRSAFNDVFNLPQISCMLFQMHLFCSELGSIWNQRPEIS